MRRTFMIINVVLFAGILLQKYSVVDQHSGVASPKARLVQIQQVGGAKPPVMAISNKNSASYKKKAWFLSRFFPEA